MTALRKIRVLCVDDHPMIREGVSAMIKRQSDMELVGAAATGEQAVELFRDRAPDVTLMDLQLPSMSGLEAIRALRRADPEARVIVLTMFQGDEDIHRALQAGAATYLLKDVRSAELLSVIRQVHAGERPYPAAVRTLLAGRTGTSVLTSRENDVMLLIAKGLRNKEIAGQLNLSEETVKVHVKSILAKFGVQDRSAAIRVALQRGFVHLD